jgi:hypothetical protein
MVTPTQQMVNHQIRRHHTLVDYKPTHSSLTIANTETTLMAQAQDLMVMVVVKTTMALHAMAVEIGLLTK